MPAADISNLRIKDVPVILRTLEQLRRLIGFVQGQTELRRRPIVVRIFHRARHGPDLIGHIAELHIGGQMPVSGKTATLDFHPGVVRSCQMASQAWLVLKSRMPF